MAGEDSIFEPGSATGMRGPIYAVLLSSVGLQTSSSDSWKGSLRGERAAEKRITSTNMTVGETVARTRAERTTMQVRNGSKVYRSMPEAQRLRSSALACGSLLDEY